MRASGKNWGEEEKEKGFLERAWDEGRKIKRKRQQAREQERGGGRERKKKKLPKERNRRKNQALSREKPGGK